MGLGRWPPHFMEISFSTKKLLSDQTRWKPVWSLKPKATDIRTSVPVLTALQKYTASGWTVWVLPWAVGTRGFVHEQSLHDTLKFLDICQKQWSSIIQDSVCALVQALAFMCKLLFSLYLQNQSFNTDDPQSYLKMHAGYEQSGRKLSLHIVHMKMKIY